MDFKAAEEYLEKTSRFGIKQGLERITVLCSKLDRPQLDFPSIHITGTNGKTSTARMVSSIMQTAVTKIGRYTSPHMQNVTERICINGRPIAETEFAKVLEKIIPTVEETNGETGDPLTYFEITTAMAFIYFAERKIDLGVIEVGLGGRWDATNLIESQIQIITGIALDHIAELGDSLGQIAMEKAGIIKPASTVVSAADNFEVLDVIEGSCHEKGCDLKLLGRDFDVLYNVSYGVDTGKIGQAVGIKGLLREYPGIFLPLLGEHQAVNAACAVAACEAYAGSMEDISIQQVEKGLSRVTSPGRLEVVSLDPLVLLDGAHNPDGAMRLSYVIQNDLDYERLVLVIGILEDKDFNQILEILLPLASTVVATQSADERATPVRKIEAAIKRMGYDCVVVEHVDEAVKFARTLAGVGDMVCITGSLYTVGEARTALGLRPQ